MSLFKPPERSLCSHGAFETYSRYKDFIDGDFQTNSWFSCLTVSCFLNSTRRRKVSMFKPLYCLAFWYCRLRAGALQWSWREPIPCSSNRCIQMVTEYGKVGSGWGLKQAAFIPSAFIDFSRAKLSFPCSVTILCLWSSSHFFIFFIIFFTSFILLRFFILVPLLYFTVHTKNIQSPHNEIVKFGQYDLRTVKAHCSFVYQKVKTTQSWSSIYNPSLLCFCHLFPRESVFLLFLSNVTFQKYGCFDISYFLFFGKICELMLSNVSSFYFFLFVLNVSVLSCISERILKRFPVSLTFLSSGWQIVFFDIL